MASITNAAHTYSPIPQVSKDEPLSISIPIPASEPLPTYKEDDVIVLLKASAATILPILIVWLLWWSQKEDHAAPIFTINSLYISNFSVGTGGLTATWDAKMVVINNSSFSKVSFRSIGVGITYKENPISEDYSGCDLDPGQTATLHMRFVNRGTAGWRRDEPYLENELLNEISEEVARLGSLTVGMKMTAYASYYDTRKWSPIPFYKYDHEVMTANCDNLNVKFLPDKKDLGRLVSLNRNFSIPILERSYDLKW